MSRVFRPGAQLKMSLALSRFLERSNSEGAMRAGDGNLTLRRPFLSPAANSRPPVTITGLGITRNGRSQRASPVGRTVLTGDRA